MKYMTTAEIRETYLSFFEKKGCVRMPSSSLIPDDPSLLLTSAGMVQFKPYFLQQKHLDDKYIGATTSQKCVRTNDIDIIGTTGRHLSFFEMLGNFSFGKYFKKEMCAWALEFSLDVLELPKEKLYFTVYEEDDETEKIWLDLGIDPSHLSRLGADDNFWRAGSTGPCGPCSEIYFDKGEACGCGSPTCKPGCDCDRYVEYWNCVFTQFDAQEDGSMPELPHKNIDTGMGLERMAAIMQGVTSNYETDVLRSLIGVGERLGNVVYGEDEDVDLALRIMADHTRAVTFMIADGILPSNEGRGYVLRRLLRRAIMKGNHIGIEGQFINEYVDEIVRLMGDVYPEIVENRELERKLILSEEKRFGATLAYGKAYLEEELDKVENGVLPGSVAFKLHDTYGYPLEVTIDFCNVLGISVDVEGFEAEMEKQRDRARHAGADDAEAAWSTYGGIYADILSETGATKFVGYDNSDCECRILALVKDGEKVDALEAGVEGNVILDVTPFYAEMGGQVGDTGVIASASFKANVLDTTAPKKGLHSHHVKVDRGVLSAGDICNARIDVRRRTLIERNHSATHILHAALREVLGDHVKQAGSFVGSERLRFDFTHFEAMTDEQIKEVETLANEKIIEAIPTHIYTTSLDKARESGVTALFGEKYGDEVRVVEAGDFSRELCGGCHVKNTSEIGLIRIVGESSIGANLRRIEALTSAGALEYVNRVFDELKETADELKVPLFDVCERTASNIKTLKDMRFKASKAKQGNVIDGLEKILSTKKTSSKGFAYVVAELPLIDGGAVRNVCDVIKAKLGDSSACVLAGKTEEGKALIIASGTDAAVSLGFNAGDIIKQVAPLIKGGGGGKPSMAQAGGADCSGITSALEKAEQLIS